MTKLLLVEMQLLFLPNQVFVRARNERRAKVMAVPLLKRKKSKGDGSSIAAPVAKSGDRESFSDMWKNAFKLNYHGEQNAPLPLTMSSSDVSADHEIFAVRPADVLMSEEDFVEGIRMFSQSVAMFHPEQTPIEIRRNVSDDSLLGCYLITNSKPVVGNISARNASHLLAYQPTKQEIADDCERSHVPFGDSSGACQRSLLEKATANATHV